MKVRETIQHISESDWLEITEQRTLDYKSHLGKVPKILISEAVLEQELVQIGTPVPFGSELLYPILIKANNY